MSGIRKTCSKPTIRDKTKIKTYLSINQNLTHNLQPTTNLFINQRSTLIVPKP